MADWQTISSLATAGGTLVLAVATFSAVRSANHSARVAERTFLTAMRPLLIPSLSGDPTHKVVWHDAHTARVDGGRGVLEQIDGVIYLAIGLRNVGSGLALLHAWFPRPGMSLAAITHAEPPDFRRLTVDLYVPPGGTGYWEGALRDPNDPLREQIRECIDKREPVTIELLYGDEEGGQRRISRFMILPGTEDGWYCQVGRHWNVDQPDPR
jgi:hypothetical protein